MQQKIQPLPVPWKIDGGAPLLTLTLGEGTVLEITFIGVLLDQEQREKGQYSRADHRIIVRFGAYGWTRTTPQDYFNPSDYDWSSIEKNYRPYETLPFDVSHIAKAWGEKYHFDWMHSNNCPMPYAYIVQDSLWIQQTQIHRVLKNYQHYLFMGEDMYIEVLGDKFSWESQGVIDWSQAKPYKPKKE